MLGSLEELLDAIRPLYPEGSLPKPFLVLEGIRRLKAGEAPDVVAKSVRTTAKRLSALLDRSADPVAAVLKSDLESAKAEAKLRRARVMLGQLLLGLMAERAFEKIYKATMGTNELQLQDARESRNETDYLVLNGQNHPVFRINIKFHGTLFRKAATLVNLEPEDCFALATYKIYQALQKQDREVLPYIFAIVSVPHLTGGEVGKIIPENLVHLAALVQSGKRDVEDRIVEHLLDAPQPRPLDAQIKETCRRIEGAVWRVISARKANQLLREKLFDRVYAVRVRAFARNYRNAELDMHFSLEEDLTPLQDFLTLLRERGLHGLTAHLERGLV